MLCSLLFVNNGGRSGVPIGRAARYAHGCCERRHALKRVALTVFLLLVVAAPAFAVRTVLVVDEVIRMSKAGVADDEIITYVKKTPDQFEINGDDVIAMNDAHVSSAVMKFVIDESAARMKDARSNDGRTREATRTVYVRPMVSP